mmetsp:Transcript_35627/g.93512  ORF Transcript_35627/g.93512 Transcript_35627/m.93512 type:complete len:150 (-) Transcript_35627:15-464(-)
MIGHKRVWGQEEVGFQQISSFFCHPQSPDEVQLKRMRPMPPLFGHEQNMMEIMTHQQTFCPSEPASTAADAFQVMMRAAPMTVEAGSCESCLRSGRKPVGVCSFCSKKSCSSCLCVCEFCQNSFCARCSTINYNFRVEKIVCIECNGRC